jgi:hypothetical protein
MAATLIFSFTFLLIVNKHLLKSFFEGFIKGKTRSEDLNDQKLLDFIKNKSGLSLKKIKLLDTQTTWGMMAGLPFMPYMIISQDAYKSFSKDEMQWLLLHEAGHYALWHNLQLMVMQLSFIAIGVLLLNQFNSPFLALILGILFAALSTRLARNFEYEANYYAISKMDNPKGLKNMYKKAQERWRGKNKKDTFIQKLFNVWTLDIYEDLVKKALRSK